MKSIHRPRAFMMADVMMALGLLAIITVIFITATFRTDRATDRLSSIRYANHVAESVLCNLQAGLPIPQSDNETKITMEPCEGGATVPGRHWARVVVTYRGQSSALVGLVPDTAATQPGGAQ